MLEAGGDVKKLALALMLVSVLGCVSVRTPDIQIDELGIAEVQRCVKKYDQGMLIEEDCLHTKTDAFSGWKAITDGIFLGLKGLLYGPFAALM